MCHLVDWCRSHLEELEETAAMFELEQLQQLHLGRDISSGHLNYLRTVIMELRALVKEPDHAARTYIHPDDIRTVPMTLELDPHTAKALENPAMRARIEQLIQEGVWKARADELMAAIAALKQEAHRRGLTGGIVDEELAAYNAERRGTPPQA